MQEPIRLYNDDCLNVLKALPDKSIDLIVTDPPYQIDNTKAGGKSLLAKSIQQMNDEIRDNNLTKGFNLSVLDELARLMRKPNIYVWCNGKQIPMYLKYFVGKWKMSFDIIVWTKTNATPLFHNKYLSDKEYCLYFRKGGYCQPQSYEKARTVYFQPINIKDKRLYGHPTIKPLNIIENLVETSSRPGEVVLDPFMGSGTVGVACKKLGRKFIGVELDPNYFQVAEERIEHSAP